MAKKLNASSWVFLAVVLICSVFVFFQTEEEESTENRRKAPLPEQISWQFPEQFDAYYQDHFPFRSFLIKKFYTLRKSIKDNPKVIMGDEDWIFLNSAPFNTYAKSDNTVGDFTGKTLLNEEGLQDFADKIKIQKEFYDRLGIKLFVMIPPNKMTVYSEYLPRAYRKLKSVQTRYEQTEQIFQQQGIPFINLKTVFASYKNADPIYYRTDTHWNDFGAYIAFEQLAKVLNKQVPAIQSVKKEQAACGDNYRMSGAVEACTDVNYIPAVDFKNQAGTCVSQENPGHVVCTNPDAPFKERLVIGRDSFTEKMIPYIARTFEKAVFIWSGKVSDEELYEIILREKPDYVIYTYAERNVSQLSKDAPK